MLVDNTNKIESSKIAVSITLTISNEYKIFTVNIKFCYVYIPLKYYFFTRYFSRYLKLTYCQINYKI